MVCDLCGEKVFPEELSEARPIVAHNECMLREVLGGIGHLIAHDWWCVVRKDPDAGLSYRQSAKLARAWTEAVGFTDTDS